MNRIWLIILCFIAFACNNKNDKMQHEPLYNEAALKSFVISTSGISEKNAQGCLDSILQTAAGDSAIFRQTVSYFEKPFADPNSTYRDENLYIQLLKAKINSIWYDSTSKTQARDKLYLVMQNHVGSAANDFTYITAAGFKKKMYDIRADYTLLYFYNPECEACKEMKTSLIASAIISNKATSGELKILAVYTDKDEKLWLDHLKEMPEEWIQGRDENEYLYKNSVYDLKAIPTVYLLDRSKNVVLKDCTDVRDIENILNKNK